MLGPGLVSALAPAFGNFAKVRSIMASDVHMNQAPRVSSYMAGHSCSRDTTSAANDKALAEALEANLLVFGRRGGLRRHVLTPLEEDFEASDPIGHTRRKAERSPKDAK